MAELGRQGVWTMCVLCALVWWSISEARSDDIYYRERRQTCNKVDEDLTMANFIHLVKKIESHDIMKNKPLQDVANMLRSLFATDPAYIKWKIEWSKFQWTNLDWVDVDFVPPRYLYILGKKDVDWDDRLLAAEEKAVLLRMILHRDDGVTFEERGTVRTSGGDTVAVGHVIFGIMAGLERDTDHGLVQWYKDTSYKLDNVYVATISGDLGQTTLTKHTGKTSALIGPAGSWNGACPSQYILSGPASEATDAEVLGDLDGFVLGAGVKSLKNKKLSQIFEQYYDSGIGGDTRLRHSRRIENFNQLVVDLELIYQSTGFFEAYGNDAAKKYKTKIPSTIYTFYEQSYMTAGNCQTSERHKYNIANFITMVRRIETGTGSIKATVNSILGLASYYKQSYFEDYLDDLGNSEPIDDFDKYAINGMIDHKVDTTFRRQVGLITDNNGDTIAIGHVLAGISAGLDRKTSGKLEYVFGATIAGDLVEAAKSWKREEPRFGPTGSWDTNCPPRYNIDTSSPTTAASPPEILGDMDGLILGKVVAGTSIKLSDLLSQYYGNGLTSDPSVSSSNRTSKFRAYAPLSKVEEQVGLVCEDSWFSYFDGCDVIKTSWSEAFYKKFLSSSSGKGNLYGGGRLPSYSILRQVYPPQTTSDDDLYILAGIHKTPSSRPDVLRLALMLNRLEGHCIRPSDPGSVQGQNDKHYIVGQSQMVSYLTSRYGLPVKVSSEASVRDKPGIVLRGAMTLWNGATTMSGSGEISLWEAKGSGACSYLADQGNCDFYLQCIETPLGCKHTDYPRAYGYKYCTKFGDHYTKFDDEGKVWADEVRICLMKTLLPRLKDRTMTCSKIKEIAFQSHVGCYLRSGVGFCNVMISPPNWDALLAVYEVGDFFNEDWKHAWEQVGQTIVRCSVHIGFFLINWRMILLKHLIDLVKDRISPKEGVLPAAVLAANTGKCTFYEHFEKRFPCADVSGISHMVDVELPLCMRGYSPHIPFQPSGLSWYENYQKCLTGALLPIYEGGEVTCTALRLTVYEKRLECMVSSGLCDVLIANEFALDKWADPESFPYIIPTNRIVRPLDRSYVVLKPIFYWNALDLHDQFVDALALCAQDGSPQQVAYDTYVKTRSIKLHFAK